ncbi:class I SAM-dependent DNA methyltransferase [Halosolutus gelatinilyticus]|uniref:class I SAM-dependent DNA methyltransferase n=1 Tax=Halosolutus gelatinilyticus TaxID=2931975 RepID=UPI001FF54BD3|nr:class I SAM-dependent methyltransferase [Halosolutus gelatinilyticus]
MASEDEPVAKAAYDELADTYADEVRTNPYNADLEFPATSSLVPDVDGKRVLDAGCGTGAYTEWLLDRGADVVGVDVSEAMLAHARERVGDRATFHRADLAAPLEFAETDAFDGVVSALALGYVEEWRESFSEFARILEPGGFFVFSTGHPFDQFPFGGDDGRANYFDVELAEKNWEVDVPYYRRPVSAVVNPLLESGFRLERLLEPRPTERFEETWPERYEKESRYPVFLCVRSRLS